MVIERQIGAARGPVERASNTTGVGQLSVKAEATTACRGPDAQKAGPARVDWTTIY